ncbi:MAG: hypothetical protein WCO86_02210 [Planctomycetota bacterium]
MPVLLFDGIPHKIPAAIPAELYDFTLRCKQEKPAAVPFVPDTNGVVHGNLRDFRDIR